MNFLQKFGLRLAGVSTKSAWDYVPVGVTGRAVPRSYDTSRLIDAARTNEVAYACISTKQRTAVDPRLFVERKQGNEWNEIEGHPLRRLIMRPNPDLDEIGFWQWFIASRDIAGEFYAEIVRNTKTGPPTALYPLNPSCISPMPNSDGTIGAYQFKLGNFKDTIPAENMLVWRNVDIGNKYRGLSPLAVALGAIAGDTSQTDYINEFFKVGGVPSGFLKIKGRTVTQTESDEIREKWRAKFSPQAGGSMTDIAVLDENADFQVLGSKLNELQSEELRGVAESRICMVFGVPPLVIYAYIGLLRSIQSNLREAWQQFWDSTLTPEYKAMRAWLTMRMLPEFESDDLVLGERVRCAWDMSTVAALQDDVDGIQKRARDNYAAGGITRDEFRSVIGLPPGEDEVVAVDDIQTRAMNGSQIASMVQVVQAVSANTLAPQAAIEMLTVSFPSVERATIEKIIAAAGQIDINTDDAAKQLLPHRTKQTIGGDDDARRMDDSREKIIAKMQPKIETYLTDEYEAAGQRIKAAQSTDAGVSGTDEGDALSKRALPYYKMSIKAAYDDAEITLADLGVGLSFDLANPKVQEVIGDLLKKLRGVTDTTREDIRAVIAKGLTEGRSIDQIADDITANAPEISRMRAERIARTETAAAYTRGAILAYQDSGVVEEVEWLSTLDNRTSEVCTALNGQRSPLGEPFAGGFIGPPAHPNCRSVILPVV